MAKIKLPFVKVEPVHSKKNCVLITSVRKSFGFCQEDGEPKKNKINDPTYK